MRFIITIIAVLFTLNSTLGQERLTTIISDNSNAFYFAEVVDDVRYIVEIDQDDKLNVGILNVDYSLTPLHSKVLKGMFNDYQFRIDGALIYAFDDTTPVIYNYVENTEIRIEIPSEWIPQFWSTIGDSLALVRVSDLDNSAYKYFLVNKEGDVLSGDESLLSISKIFKDYFFKRSQYTPNENPSYYMEHISSGFRDTLMRNIDRNVSIVYNNELIYIDENDNFYRFNMDNGMKTKIPNVSFSVADVWSIKVIDDILFIQNRVSFGKYIIYMYDLDSGTFKQFLEHDDIDDFHLKESFIAQGKLVVNDRSNMVVFDIESGAGVSYPSDYGQDLRIPIMDDRYIFTASYWESSYVDLKTGTQTMVTNDVGIYPYEYAKIIQMDGDYLGIFSSLGATDKSIFRLDIQNNTFDHVSAIDNTNEGLYYYDTEVLKFGEDIVLGAKDIYSVEGNIVTKINPYELVELQFSPYKVYKDHITFLCKNESVGHYFYTYDGSTLIEEAFLPYSNPFPYPDAIIRDFAVTSKNMFFTQGIFSDTKMFKYDKSSGEIVEIGGPNWYLFDLEFYQSGDDVYFDYEDIIYRVEEDGTLSFVLSNEVEGSVRTGLVENNGNCYNISNSEISILKGNTAEQILSGEFEMDLILNSSTRSKSFFISSYEAGIKKGIVYVDGEFAMELEFEYRVSAVVKASNNHYFIHTRDNPTNDRRLYIFNGDAREINDITYLNTENHYYRLFFKESEPYFVTYNTTINKMTVYKLEDSFSTATQVYTTDYFGGSNGVNFIEIGNVGMIYLGRDIGIVSDDFTVHNLKVKGNGGMTEMVVNEQGFVYFIASDVKYGNQLYRIDPSNFTSSSIDVKLTSNLKVYPNPFQDFISVDEQFDGFVYSIVDANGKIVIRGIVQSSEIKLHQLKAGLYYLSIVNGTSTYSTPIVKQ